MGADGLNHIVRLSATPGAVATDAVTPTPSALVPMGWSVADRLLYARNRISSSGDLVSDLVTEPVGGGSVRLLDRAVEDGNWLNRGIATAASTEIAHYGYFVPGTSIVVYGDGSTQVTNSDGLTFPRFDIRLISDSTGAVPKSIHGTALPLAWHQEPVFDPPEPLPFVITDVPNVELIDRFAH